MNKDMGVGCLSIALATLQDGEYVSFPLDNSFKEMLREEFAIQASYGLISKKGIDMVHTVMMCSDWLHKDIEDRTVHLPDENGFVLLDGTPRPISKDGAEVEIVNLSYQTDIFHDASPSVRYTTLIDALKGNYPVYHLMGQ